MTDRIDCDHLEHVDDCAACRARREADDRVAAALRAAFPRDGAPGDLVARVTAAALAAARDVGADPQIAYWTEAGRQARRWLAVAAAALIVSSLWAVIALRRDPSMERAAPVEVSAAAAARALDLAASHLDADTLADASTLDADTMAALTFVGLSGPDDGEDR